MGERGDGKGCEGARLEEVTETYKKIKSFASWGRILVFNAYVRFRGRSGSQTVARHGDKAERAQGRC